MDDQLTEWSFTYREELENILSEFCIDKNDICLVGNLSLSLRGIRSCGDIDFCSKTNTHSKLNEYFHGNYISNHVALVVGKYERLGISDEELIYNSDYHELIDGFKVVRLELEFSIKNCGLWEKDFRDISLLEQYALNSDNWKWSLVIDDPSLLNSVKKRSANLVNIEVENNLSREDYIKEFIKKVFWHERQEIIKRVMNLSLYPKQLLEKIWSSNPKVFLQKNWISKKLIYIRNKLNVIKVIESEIILKYPTTKLLAYNVKCSQFMRMDIIVRYLAIEEYFGRNNVGFTLYRKMQRNRLPHDSTEYEKKFKDLIKSFSTKGFESYSPILIDLEFNLIDGSHRLAIATYFRIPEVPLKILPVNRKYEYGLSWFKENGFSEDEIDIIENKYMEVCKKQGLFFFIILWPAAQEFFDDIENDLNKTYQVIESQDLSLDEEGFQIFLREIYKIDGIEKWKVERKIHAMFPYSKILRVLSIEIPNPNFEKRNNQDFSDVSAKIKIKYRSKYLSKIDNYIFDIIIFTTDNYAHNLQVAKVLKDFNLFDLRDGLNSRVNAS